MNRWTKLRCSTYNSLRVACKRNCTLRDKKSNPPPVQRRRVGLSAEPGGVRQFSYDLQFSHTRQSHETVPYRLFTHLHQV
jgi:hypothetical protein